MKKSVSGQKNISMKIIISSLMILLMLLSSIPGLTGNSDAIIKIKAATDPVPLPSSTYREYLNKYLEADRPDVEIILDNTMQTGGEPYTADLNGESKEGVFTPDDGSVNWTFNVPESGLYNIKIEYCTIESKGSIIERRILIDGQLPYSNAGSVSLNRIWIDGSPLKDDLLRRFRTDSADNELFPIPVELPAWISTFVKDSSGYIVEPLQFYFSEGSHTLEIVSVREPLVIGSVVLCQSPEILEYEEYASGNSTIPGISDFELKLQGENADFRSDATIIPIIDRTSASTEPSHYSKVRLNTIGGVNWAASGQWIEWETEVPETGLYKIGIKYRQNFLSGMTANRRLLINGEMPFLEADRITFPYSRKWQSKIVGDEDKEFLFYLESGKKHRIRLENSYGESASLLENAQKIVGSLNDGYRQLVMFAGSDPDVNRDYKIDEALPQVIDIFKENLSQLGSLSVALVEFSGQRGDANVVIDNVIDMIERMLRDTRDIPKLMHAFRDNIGGLATWVYTQSRQSLEIDYISILGKDDQMDRPDDSFLSSFAFKARSFVGSFFNDYSLLNSDSGDQVIDVWLTAGRDQAQIVSNLITNYFTPDKNIGVNLKLMNNNGQLLMATVAGEGPDVSLMSSSADIINFALRHAVEDLNGYPGFESHLGQFKDSAVQPMTIEGKTYGLPETQTFPVLFYRSDVLSELDINIPQTWEDLYNVIGTLQRNNLQFGFPGGIIGYGMILYQNKEEFYLDGGRRTGLSTNGAIEAFKQWTRLYNNYGLPVEYDPANRFRSGEMPMLISDYTLYNTLSVFAPEIIGLWDFTQVPGTVDESSEIDRSVASIVSGCIMIRQSEKKENAWEFMKWWTGDEAQYLYGRNLESIIGTAARYPSANIVAAAKIPWKSSEYNTLVKQWDNAKGIPEVAGGYFTSRHIENAFRRVINFYEDEREVIINYSKIIDEEIMHKRKELGLE